MKLHEYNEIIERCFATENEVVDTETGEIFDADYLDRLEMDKNEKVKNLVNWIKSMDDDVDALDKQLKKLRDWKSTKEKRIESVKNYIASCLNYSKWEAEDGTSKISYRKSTALVVDDLASIDDMYFKKPHTESNLDKTTIKEMIKSGMNVAGVHMEDKQNIQIK